MIKTNAQTWNASMHQHILLWTVSVGGIYLEENSLKIALLPVERFALQTKPT